MVWGFGLNDQKQIPPLSHILQGSHHYRRNMSEPGLRTDIPHLHRFAQEGTWRKDAISLTPLNPMAESRAKTYTESYTAQDISKAPRKRRRPPFSYCSLIAQAILESPEQKMTLRDIYQWVMQKYPSLYKPDDNGWQNTIRHNLSLNKCFQKVPKTEGDLAVSKGKGGYWTVDRSYLPLFSTATKPDRAPATSQRRVDIASGRWNERDPFFPSGVSVLHPNDPKAFLPLASEFPPRHAMYYPSLFPPIHPLYHSMGYPQQNHLTTFAHTHQRQRTHSGQDPPPNSPSFGSSSSAHTPSPPSSPASLISTASMSVDDSESMKDMEVFTPKSGSPFMHMSQLVGLDPVHPGQLETETGNDELVQVTDPTHPANLIPELCRQFYHLGWVTGTGGGISIRKGEHVYIAPSGVQKERMQPGDLFVLTLTDRTPLRKPLTLKPSACTPLFYNAYTMRQAGACIHTHSQHAVMATLLFSGSEFAISHQEMIKGIRRGSTRENLRYFDRLVVPIVENTPEEEDLTDRMAQAIEAYPETNAVLVRRHGVYVWGESWEKAKTMAECYDYLFEIAVKMKSVGIDPSVEPEETSVFK
ncbi:hypothetical protein BZG36_01475 [Bifiguratus adelaidae]|uniref:Methylthioribulose-1-phosphate dehydratase n=1 Tax=Bifiguratus adelaidae TaxID=1938954 RepID=A0A261Y4V9_9FUNG|nr:hypothetical protein BZG36_01475 [Bifiguratus adelaidae]